MTTDSERIAQRAADFLARSWDETPDQRLTREAWLAADPRHARAYRYLQRLDEKARRLGQDPDLRALLGKGPESE